MLSKFGYIAGVLVASCLIICILVLMFAVTVRLIDWIMP